MGFGASTWPAFPFLFGGTFIEGGGLILVCIFLAIDFPSFSEGLSLRATRIRSGVAAKSAISLPFRRDFH